MIGFDNYIPMKWLDGILAVHVVTPVKISQKPAFRRGSWIKNGILTVAVLAGGVVAVAAPSGPNATIEVLNQVLDRDRASAPFAPAGYFEKLTAVIKAASRLSAQSISSDPPILV